MIPTVGRAGQPAFASVSHGTVLCWLLFISVPDAGALGQSRYLPSPVLHCELLDVLHAELWLSALLRQTDCVWQKWICYV